MVQVKNVNPMFGPCVVFEGETIEEAVGKYTRAVESLFDLEHDPDDPGSYREGVDYVVLR